MVLIDATEKPRPARDAARPAQRRAWGWILCLGLLLGVSALARDARATPEYPLVIDTVLDTDCPQLTRCLICHTSARGGQSTAVQPFAQTLRRYGLLRGRDSGALRTALASLPPTTDSDSDGTPDTEELMVCGNPSGDDLGDGPEYGCDGAHLVARLPEDVPLGVLALLVAGALVRRRVPRAAGRSERA